ncbi:MULTISPECIES: efflux RND transporter periplasmic adaptor subunit [Leeuwenhoekiella]|uniref:Putative metal transport-related, exported protein n=1 Tax=Leeuwenhoekiella blandensis (strain CECT 7118 / CCUG 51940 / KCTC 22103 / MED217) TaxID=398720 RepID=A3XKB8_LEEBM|nr:MULTISPECIES: efflux RND transporter periplasmic adaptor subunit [Leeuwenhoekiella]EAQ50010.1 putative metal transport-related, exported protein [Leeuwenhoekiella blandensis MED217]MAO42628.1 efflux RND transporter periplasmic adaptor subunit [Leeuwenhoekiella sp.]MBQ52334.1 efflux RND transporter periplasmic adaptor subunit [Leeuwenhoekiella sp.]HBT10414.1 efflux RND transporter periplasmic adaptor subunit [Leeuwenhoekiella sp.]|tara:strand:- start:7207 stop:9009 length:1803 start_codon:yes stop_codon:yes gene_type:complete
MNKNIIYIGVALIVGLLGGYLIFGGGSADTATNKVKDDHNHSEEIASGQMWTCSMHPQIMQPEPGDCPICGMDLIPAETGADGLLADQFKMTENAMALANIQTTVVGSGAIEAGTLKLSGKIRENEESNAVQVTYFAGRIERLYVNSTGERVGKGQRLATIYSPELVSAQQELLTAASLKESQPELYSAVRNKLKLWKLSEKQINSIEQAGKVQEYFPVYATVSGTVTHKMVEEGDYVKLGQPLYKIANLNTVWAEFDAYENQIASLKEGQSIKIVTNAYPNQEFNAKISFIDPLLNSATRTIVVRAVLNNRKDKFKPGMFVEGKVEGTEMQMNEAINVPASAVMWTGERSVVYVKTNPNEPVFEMRDVLLGNASGDTYTIIEGLQNGDEIVTNGTFTVDAAAQLQGKKSMMNAEGGKTMTGHEGHLGMQNDGSGDKMNNTSHSEMNKRIEVASKFQNQLKRVFEDYILLKDALVNDNATEAQTAAKKIGQNLAKVDMKLLTNEEAHNHWMTIQKELKNSANAIENNSDIATQRGHFKHLSAHITSGIKLFGVNQKVYRDFCPMADNNKGAFWLSLEEEIRNPYYGEAMLKCGEVRETIE